MVSGTQGHANRAMSALFDAASIPRGRCLPRIVHHAARLPHAPPWCVAATNAGVDVELSDEDENLVLENVVGVGAAVDASGDGDGGEGSDEESEGESESSEADE